MNLPLRLVIGALGLTMLANCQSMDRRCEKPEAQWTNGRCCGPNEPCKDRGGVGRQREQPRDRPTPNEPPSEV